MKKTQIEMFALKCGVGKVLLVPECYEVLFEFSRCDQMAIKIHLESEKKQGYRSERIALGHFVLSVPTSVFERNAFHARGRSSPEVNCITMNCIGLVLLDSVSCQCSLEQCSPEAFLGFEDCFGGGICLMFHEVLFRVMGAINLARSGSSHILCGLP